MTTLGALGVLPPDPVGARVDVGGRSGVIVDAPAGYATVGVRYEDGSEEAEDRSGVRLDLSPPYNLDDATRLLWHLLDLGEQPLTAPGWGRAESMSWGYVWLLGRPDEVEIGVRSRGADGPGVYVQNGEGYVVCAEATRETDPRQALALVLATVAEARR